MSYKAIGKNRKKRLFNTKEKGIYPKLILDPKKKLLSINEKNNYKPFKFLNVAKSIGIEPATLKAVIDVEAAGRGFLRNGKPKILFEGHIFWNQLLAKGINPNNHLNGNLNILYPNWTRKFYIGGVGEYRRLDKAILIHEEAALKSASWGLFQVMGFNFHLTKYSDVHAFVDAMYQSEYEHLQAFLGYITNRNLIVHLKNKNWAAFASGYNGKDYRKNRYDVKLTGLSQI